MAPVKGRDSSRIGQEKKLGCVAILVKASVDHRKALKVEQPLNIVPGWGKALGSLYSFFDQPVNEGCSGKGHDWDEATLCG